MRLHQRSNQGIVSQITRPSRAVVFTERSRRFVASEPYMRSIMKREHLQKGEYHLRRELRPARKDDRGRYHFALRKVFTFVKSFDTPSRKSSASILKMHENRDEHHKGSGLDGVRLSRKSLLGLVARFEERHISQMNPGFPLQSDPPIHMVRI